MNAPTAIVRVTSRNVLGLRRLMGFGLLSLVPGVIFILATRSDTDFGKAETFTAISLAVFLPIVVPIITVVISSSVLGSERRGDTLSFLMLRPLSRYSIAAAKLASAIVASFAITAAGALLLGFFASLALNDFGYLSSLLVATLITTAGYAAVFMPLGYLTERATLIGFIYIFVWERVATAVEGLAGTSLFHIGATALVGLGPAGLDINTIEDNIGSLTPGAGGAAVKMLVVAGISILFTGWLLRTRDLT